MSSISPEGVNHWQEVNHRIAAGGLDLTLRTSSTPGHLKLLAIDNHGATEKNLTSVDAIDAFLHPGANDIGLEQISGTNGGWNAAFDSFNTLTPSAKQSAMEIFDGYRTKMVTAPELLMSAARLVSEMRHLDRPF